MKSKKNTLWLYGKHTCFSALQNKYRESYELFITKTFYEQNQHTINNLIKEKNIIVNQVAPHLVNQHFPKEVNHQGIALRASSRQNYSFEDLILHNEKDRSIVLILDQVLDVHNVGAIIRTSACFDVDVVVLTQHNSPEENCAMAKTSSGALDIIPVVRVTNLVNTIKFLKDQGYWCYGFDSNEGILLNTMKDFCKKSVIVLGSEEKGARRLTKENCDFLIKIPISDKIDSLNVSNAAAIALYVFQNKAN